MVLWFHFSGNSHKRGDELQEEAVTFDLSSRCPADDRLYSGFNTGL
jgi:hypothetical protein